MLLMNFHGAKFVDIKFFSIQTQPRLPEKYGAARRARENYESNGLDQIVPNGGERRTALSASYTQFFKDSSWQSTLGWGRTSRKFREATTGYLLDSMLKFNGGHTIFGRLEQVGSDELLRQEDSLERQLFKLKKLTIGYSHNLRVSGSGPGNLDLGVMVSRYFTPAQMTGSYGDKPITYMMFVRLNLQ